MCIQFQIFLKLFFEKFEISASIVAINCCLDLTRGASSLQKKKLSWLNKYSVAKSFYCSKYKKYTSEPKLKFKFSASVL